MINILGKIDLESLPSEKPKFKAEKYKPALDKKMTDLSWRLNNDYGDIFENDGSISLNNAEDKEFVEERESTWSKEMGKTREAWLKDKELNKSSLAETSITLLLDKAIGDDFVISKSSKYDDYKHGVDNIILDKETGNVVCGYDDVLGHRGDDGGEKKSRKIRKIMEKGGVNLKQGLDFKEDGTLAIKELHNLPAFYLALSKDDLEKLLEITPTKENESLGDFEKSIITKFITSMETQLGSLDISKLNKNLQENVLKFQESLEKIKNKIL